MSDLKTDLSDLNGFVFVFAQEFRCWVENGLVFIEEYWEGAFTLDHIKTIDQFKNLYTLLTGDEFKM